jgi:hypothetical protein
VRAQAPHARRAGAGRRAACLAGAGREAAVNHLNARGNDHAALPCRFARGLALQSIVYTVACRCRQREKNIGSGRTGADGTRGARAVRAGGGQVQEESSPHSPLNLWTASWPPYDAGRADGWRWSTGEPPFPFPPRSLSCSCPDRDSRYVREGRGLGTVHRDHCPPAPLRRLLHCSHTSRQERLPGRWALLPTACQAVPRRGK